MQDLHEKYSFFIHNESISFSNNLEIKDISNSTIKDFCLTDESKNTGSISYRIKNPIKVMKLRFFILKIWLKSLFKKF